jgi:hypothetical protein
VSAETERVERGAALMDEKRPGWLDVIDLGRLDIAVTCDCITGQQPGGFTRVMNDLGIGHSAEAASYGFGAYAPDPDLPELEYGRIVAEEYDALTGAWRGLITRRRTAEQAIA